MKLEPPVQLLFGQHHGHAGVGGQDLRCDAHQLGRQLREGLQAEIDLSFTDKEFNTLVAVLDRDGSGDIEYKELVKEMKKHDKKRKTKRKPEEHSPKYSTRSSTRKSDADQSPGRNPMLSVEERMKELDHATQNPEVKQNFLGEMNEKMAASKHSEPSVRINLMASSGKKKKQQLKNLLKKRKNKKQI